MKLRLLFIFILFALKSFADHSVIILTKDVLSHSIANQAELCEDEKGNLKIEDLILGTGEDFMGLKHEVSNLDFTSSTYWLKFSVKNQTNFRNFIIETARPITNLVEFYEVENNQIINHLRNGDAIKFSEKPVENRKILFPFKLKNNQQKDFYLKLKSDGEVLTLPLIIYQKDEFYALDSKAQFFNGLYYGILLLIIIIYFFFFLFLQDKTFLYYIIYVAGIFLLQFSLDGYSFQFFFRNNLYLASHVVLLSASLAVFLVLLYARVYLNLKTRLPRFNKLYITLQTVMLGLGLLSLIPGFIYEIMYPMINAVSLISILLILYTVYFFKTKGITICNYFTGAFTVLIIGAVIFILGNFNIIFDPLVSQNALKLSSGLEVIILSISMATKYRDMQRAKERIQEEALINLEEKNRLMDTMNVQLEEQVKERTAEISHQKHILEEKNHEILSSIRYAERIQSAILPDKSQVTELLPNSFIFYQPKDVVSGDFYFVEETTVSTTGEKLVLFAAVDCTGHGVPGAFMSIVGNSYLRQSVHEERINSTGDALGFLNDGVCRTLRQDFQKSLVRDGMDIALCAINFEKLELYFSGAKNPVFIIRNSKLPEIIESKRNPVYNEEYNLFLNEIKGDSHPIGAYVGETLKPFKTHKIKLEKGDVIYVFSDGFSDQFGGEKGKKYNIKKFKQFLIKISQEPMSVQNELIQNEFYSWKKNFEQIDDVCIIGVSI
jgi:serine phosphatase RsbU (regulator of sigma subunit)